MSEKDAILRNLSEQREALLRAVEGLDSDQMRMPGAGGEAWSAQDVLGHIAAWERESVEALRAYLAQAEPYQPDGLQGIADRDRWNEEAVSQRRNWPVHETILELGIIRSELLSLLADLAEPQLEGKMLYPWGRYGPIRKLFEMSIDHEREHAVPLAAWRGTL